jgi:hypothetical protein
MRRLTFCLAIAVFASACSRRLGDFSSLSNRSPSAAVHKGPTVTGRDCTWVLFAIPLGEMTLEDATDAAMASAPDAEYLTDVTVRRTGWWFGRNCYEVTGSLARAHRGEAASPLPRSDWP